MLIIFQKGVNNFEIDHKTCYFLVRGVVPLKRSRFRFIQGESKNCNNNERGNKR